MSAMRITSLAVLSVFIFIAFAFTTAVHASPSSQTDLKYFKAPLLFEPNEGQSAPGIDFAPAWSGATCPAMLFCGGIRRAGQ